MQRAARRSVAALEPLRIGPDVFMVPGPQSPQPPRSAEPSRAQSLFVGFFEWLGAKLDGM